MREKIRMYSDDVLGKTSIQVHTRTHVAYLTYKNGDLRQRTFGATVLVALKNKTVQPIVKYVRPRDPHEVGERPTRISRNLQLLFRQLFEANKCDLPQSLPGRREMQEAQAA